MMFMRYAIDAIFLDKQNVVVGIVEKLAPWRCLKSSATLLPVWNCLLAPLMNLVPNAVTKL